MAVVRTPPTINDDLPGLPLSSTNIRPPLVLKETTDLMDALSEIAKTRPAVALVEGQADQFQVILPSQIMLYISKRASEEGGLIDIGEHSIKNVLENTPATPTANINKTSSTGDVLALFFPSGRQKIEKPQIVIVLEEGKPAGVIMNPAIKYT